MNNQIQPHKSTIVDLQANIMALLCYIISAVLSFIPGISYVAWLAPLVIFFLEKESHFIKFHAMQAFVLNVIGAVLGFLVTVVLGGIFAVSLFNPYSSVAAFGFVGIIGILSGAISLIVLVLAIIAMIKAYKYFEYGIPVIGGLTVKIMGKNK